MIARQYHPDYRWVLGLVIHSLALDLKIVAQDQLPPRAVELSNRARQPGRLHIEPGAASR
jgi:hypothetical protein